MLCLNLIALYRRIWLTCGETNGGEFFTVITSVCILSYYKNVALVRFVHSFGRMFTSNSSCTPFRKTEVLYENCWSTRPAQTFLGKDFTSFFVSFRIRIIRHFDFIALHFRKFGQKPSRQYPAVVWFTVSTGNSVPIIPV